MNNQQTFNGNPQETRGWEIVKQINAGLAALDPKTNLQSTSLTTRKLLAEYFKLNTHRPSRLHSAILSCAVKMALVFTDFHFVPFLKIWGIENIRPEDSETKVTDDGKKLPSVVERMTKAYAFSILFHSEEHLDNDAEQMLVTLLQKKGYVMKEQGGICSIATPAIATNVFTSEVRNRKMTFISFMTPQGEEIVTEVHTLTQYCKMRYEDITNHAFNILVRASDSGKLRVEAAYPSNKGVEESFPISIGYVEHIDTSHHHIHIFDNESRHFVANLSSTPNLTEGKYVRFVPIIPEDSNFKSAIITSIVDKGAESFGYRNAIVTYSNEHDGYCAWELLPDDNGQIMPITETGAKDQQEPTTKGYISKKSRAQILKGENSPLPPKGAKLKIVCFLKRGKDGKKHPNVVEYYNA